MVIPDQFSSLIFETPGTLSWVKKYNNNNNSNNNNVIRRQRHTEVHGRRVETKVMVGLTEG